MRLRRISRRFGVWLMTVLMLIFITAESALAFSFRPSFMPENTDPTVLSRYQNQSFTKGVSDTGLIIKFSYVDSLISFTVEDASGTYCSPESGEYSRNASGTLFLLSKSYLESLPEGKYTMTAYFSGAALEANFYVFDTASAFIIEQPSTVYANNGDNVTFSADVAVTGKDASNTADEMGITYQWYRASRSGKKWVRGAVSRIMQLNEVPDELTGYTYWCEITVPGYSAPFVTERVKLYIIGAGDSHYPLLYAVLSLLALTGLICAVLFGRKNPSISGK